MIRISRASCPGALTDNQTSSGVHYNKLPVVRELWKMQHGKCCYCEQRLPEEGHGKAVEHYRPKSVFKELKNNWDNLLLACPQCNGKKSNRFPMITVENGVETVTPDSTAFGRPAVINPCEMDPEQHIDFDFPQDAYQATIIKARNNSLEGQQTIEVVGLAQEFYTKHHRDRCLELIRAYTTILRAKNAGDQNAISAEIKYFEQRMASSSPFAGLTRSFARHYGLDKKFGVVIPDNPG